MNHSTAIEESSAKELKLLEELAYRVAENAHAPYSKFRVGAAARSAAGAYYSGCNVENASYGLTMCAERNAIASAVAEEGPDTAITDIVVVTPDGSNCAPCGACRQVISEFGPKVTIWFLKDGQLVGKSIDDLFPDRFGPGDLK